MNKIILFTVIILLLSGCNVVGGDLFYNPLNQIEETLDQSDWEQAEKYANAFEDIYQKNKWKLQLIGDEGEYEGLNESIQRMIAGVKQKDMTNVRIELATARSLISDIYSL
ncbi:DUF4363 family protein [Alkalicoccobacillus gibsonii]|uniref:DUF4363 family protein n=1 Tax=Alkalicoccobacillus gibsonii TaxID=79881 RepID=UPI001934ACB7|nr:DUF4363 family protein [Alkalicoccobacillus gibsonii]MBM0066788.1 DUF4363 family protein [Alkalicoccobacillus gibsonii]